MDRRLPFVPLLVLFIASLTSPAAPSPGRQEPARAAVPGKQGTSPPADWSSRVFEEIRKSEYRFSAAGEGRWSAPNRTHDFRASVGAQGIEVVSRTKGADEAAGGWKLALTLAAFGREEHLEAAGPVAAVAADNRVELRREGLTEWYRNDEAGLEQGFTIEKAPARGGTDRALILEMALAGGLGVRAAEDGQSVMFSTGAGAALLRYGGLRVSDSSDRPIKARIEVRPGRLRIAIDDAGASYPLRVDPLMTSPAWTAESDQTAPSSATRWRRRGT